MAAAIAGGERSSLFSGIGGSSGSISVVSDESSALFQKPKRFVRRKTGMFRVKRIGAKPLVLSYFRTGYHALIDMNWILFLVVVVLFYLSCFALWGLCYWYLTFEHKDCIANVRNWPEAFFFSVQTGMTIGYGSMYPNGCRGIIWLVTAQSLWGLLANAAIMGLAFEKVSSSYRWLVSY